MNADTSKKAGKPGFVMPPARQPATVEEFVAGAGKPPAGVGTTAPAAAEPDTTSLLPWEGQDDSVRRAQQPYRLTSKEALVLDFILKNKTGYRSRHAYVLKALLTAMQKDVKELTGEDIEFLALMEK